MSITTIVAVALPVIPLAAQEQGRSSTCTVHYENHNQIDYGPLVVQNEKGTITDRLTLTRFHFVLRRLISVQDLPLSRGAPKFVQFLPRRRPSFSRSEGEK